MSTFETTWDNAVNANLSILNGMTDAEAKIFADEYLPAVEDREAAASFVKNKDLIRTIDEPETQNMYDVVQALWGGFIRKGIPGFKEYSAQAYDAKTKPFMIIDQNPYNIIDPRRAEYENLLQLYKEEIGL